jgi:endonuclease/exonuclease/phosphatase family metal-dependent hydrolase
MKSFGNGVAKTIVIGIGALAATGGVAFLVFLAFIVVTDYRPLPVEVAETLREARRDVPAGEPVRITTFNIGYAGLDAGQDFFLDGGESSRSRSRAQTQINLAAIMQFLTSNDADIYALQEVDRRASRSFDIDQVSMIVDGVRPDYGAWFAYNYRARWVPVPVTRPMGYAHSGLLTLSRFRSSQARRYALPGDEPIPRRYFDLKRAVLQNVFPVDNGKDLYFIHLHLSAFDEGGLIRAQQIAFLTEHIRALAGAGHYVILAGDWNHLLDLQFVERTGEELPEWVALLPERFLALDFSLAFDPDVTTVRDNGAPYVAGKNFETIIDGFYISNNVTVIETRGTDLGFQHSDHNPVTVTVQLD